MRVKKINWLKTKIGDSRVVFDTHLHYHPEEVFRWDNQFWYILSVGTDHTKGIRSIKAGNLVKV